MSRRTRRSIIARTDSYKFTHHPVYPENTQRVFSYEESRGGRFSELLFNGLYPYIMEYLTDPITQDDIDYMHERSAKHFGTDRLFNRYGWEYILGEYGGLMPLTIRAVPEGTIVPARNVLMTLENTDKKKKVPWATNYVESLLLKTWYPITVGTLDREIKKLIAAQLEKTGDPAGLLFKLHDFGYRGVSSEESAEIGGAAHLINFLGTDNFPALEFVKDFYNEDMAGFSIPATEHSVMCARGEQGEVEQMARFLDAFADLPVPAIACVSDTYNIFRACSEYWGGELKARVEALNDKVLVVRPDSGDPVQVVVQVVETLDKSFGHTVNEKGYKVLNKVRVIQGDGVNYDSINEILNALTIRKYSADNIAFGMGGALLQGVNRDTQKFAIKASSYLIDGYQKDHQKSPITDNGKRSKAGRLKLIRDEVGVFSTVTQSEMGHDELITYYENGKVLYHPTFSEIRARAALPVAAEPTPEWVVNG